MKRIFVFLFTIGLIVGCSSEEPQPDLSQFERVPASEMKAHIDNLIETNDFDKTTIDMLQDLKEDLYEPGQRGSGNSETICNNSQGWIVIDNSTGAMTLYEYGGSPSGVISNPCDMDCAMDHCFGQEE